MKNRIKAGIKSVKKQKSKIASSRVKEEQLILANEIYDKWKTKLLNTPTSLAQLPGKLNELAGDLENHIKDKGIRETILNIVSLKIGDTYLAKNVTQYTIKVHAICPNASMLNNVQMICNWAGDAMVNRLEWEGERVWIACPSCHQTISQKSMKIVNTIVN